MKIKEISISAKTIVWQRANPKELALFDEDSKLCIMNCGQHALDPRTKRECKFLCGDCQGLQV